MMTKTQITNLSRLMIIMLIIGFTMSCNSNGKKQQSAKAYYLEGKELREEGSYTLAIETFNEMLSYYPYGEYTEYAWLEKAYAYTLSEEVSIAQIELNEFIQNYPNHKETDYALYLMAFSEESKIKRIIHRYFNNPAKSHNRSIIKSLNLYIDLINRYPNSKFIKPAKKSIKSLINYAAKHELLIADQYLELKAWVAAINRAKYLIKSYPLSIYTDEALLVMEKAFAGLELTRISAQVKEVYQYNKQKDRFAPSIN